MCERTTPENANSGKIIVAAERSKIRGVEPELLGRQSIAQPVSVTVRQRPRRCGEPRCVHKCPSDVADVAKVLLSAGVLLVHVRRGVHQTNGVLLAHGLEGAGDVDGLRVGLDCHSRRSPPQELDVAKELAKCICSVGLLHEEVQEAVDGCSIDEDQDVPVAGGRWR